MNNLIRAAKESQFVYKQQFKLVFSPSLFFLLFKRKLRISLAWSPRVQLSLPQNASRRGGSLLVNRELFCSETFLPAQKGGVYVQLWGITHKRFKQWKKKTSSFLFGTTQPTKVYRLSQWKDRLRFTESFPWKM